MSRPLRHLVAGGWYHVFGRGWERRRIFTDHGDRQHFLELLSGLSEKYGIEIHAYVLMDNHHHLIVRTPDANLSAGMQWFNTSYSAWFNVRHNRVGSLWQGRYRDVVIEDGCWVYALSVYVHLNPLRVAGLGLDKSGRMQEGRGYRVPSPEEATSRLQELREYRWSSYRVYAGYGRAPKWLKTSEILSRAHKDPREQVAAYRKYVRHCLTQGVEADRLEQLRDVIAIGSSGFARKIRELAGANNPEVTHRGELRKRAKESEVREAVACVRGCGLDGISAKRGDWGRPLYLWAIRKYCGVTLREAGAALGEMKPSAVDMVVRRWEERMRQDAGAQDLVRRLQKKLDVMWKVEG